MVVLSKVFVQGIWVVMNEFLSVFSVTFFHSLVAYSHMFYTTPSTWYHIDSVFALAVHVGLDGGIFSWYWTGDRCSIGCRAEQQRQPCLVHLLLLGCGLNVNLAPGYSWVPASIGSSFSLALIRWSEMFLPHLWQSMVFDKIFSLHVYLQWCSSVLRGSLWCFCTMACLGCWELVVDCP